MIATGSIIDLVERLATGGRVEYAAGPGHPTNPDVELRPLLDSIINRVPFLARDPSYLTFLDIFWTISIWNQVTNTVVNIYPCIDLDDDLHVGRDDGAYQFATATRYYRKTEQARTSFVVNVFSLAQGVTFPIDIVAVMCAPNALPSAEKTVCHDFLSWLQALTEQGGLLIEAVK